jgi:hypothetical protein
MEDTIEAYLVLNITRRTAVSVLEALEILTGIFEIINCLTCPV